MEISLLRALGQRDFALLWAGQTISFVGDGIFNVALAWQALQLPSGAAALGTALVVRNVARVAVLIVGGALADRYQKRLLILGGDLLQLIAVTGLAYIVSSGDLQLWQLALVAAATGIGSGIFLSSSSAMVPELVPVSYLESANSLRSIGQLAAYDLVGPALGGVLVAAVGTAAAFALDAATFLASILALVFIGPRTVASSHAPSSLFRDVREGYAYVARTPWIWISLVAVGTVGNFASFGPLPVLIPILVQEHLGEGAAALGFVFAGYGAGGALGALAVGAKKVPVRTPVSAYVGWMVGALGLGAVAFAPTATVAAVILGIAGFGGHIGNVVWETLLQRLVPSRLLGRVASTDWLLSLSLQPVGVAIAAPVAAWVGVTVALMGGAVLTVSTMAVGLSLRAVRNPEEAVAAAAPRFPPS